MREHSALGIALRLVLRYDSGMTTTATPTITEIIASFTDDALRQAAVGLTGRASSLNAVRDAAGNLRELTDAEEEFVTVVRAEFRARFYTATP